jgi:hypothetical protein
VPISIRLDFQVQRDAVCGVAGANHI